MLASKNVDITEALKALEQAYQDLENVMSTDSDNEHVDKIEVGH